MGQETLIARFLLWYFNKLVVVADFQETQEFNKIILNTLESITRYNIFLTFVHIDFPDIHKKADSIDIVDFSLVELYKKLSCFNYKMLYFKQASDCMSIFNIVKQSLMHSYINIQISTVNLLDKRCSQMVQRIF